MHQEKIIEEIKSTEETYINHLKLLQEFFAMPILEQKLLPNAVHSSIFGQLPTILQMNQELFVQLQKAGKDIGMPFLKLGPFLKAYSSYAYSFKQSLSLLEEWKNRSSELKELISNTESRPDVQMKITALLITPIQRVPRYKMLLRELLKYSNPNDDAYYHIESAVDEISAVAQHIDEMAEEGQMVQRLLEIQKSLNPSQNIIVPGRKILKEGILNKVSRKGKGSQRRTFFLFSDVLMYAKIDHHFHISFQSGMTGDKELDLKPNSLELCCILPVRHCKVKVLFGSDTQGLTFKLQCTGEDILVYSDNCEEGRSWVSAIKEASECASRKRQTLRKSLSFRRDVHQVRKMQVSKRSPKSESAILSHLRSAKECLTSPRLWVASKRKAEASPKDTASVKHVSQTSKCSPTVASPLTLPATGKRLQSPQNSISPSSKYGVSCRDRGIRQTPVSCRGVLRRNLEKSLLSQHTSTVDRPNNSNTL